MGTYRINEIFYSLQGEGRWTGRPAVFVRFSGCNLRCPFCDTDFSSSRLMTLPQLLAAVREWRCCGFVVLTGGEPTLQADEALVDALHAEGWYVAIETNGTHPVAEGIDWVTCSPKSSFVAHADVVLRSASEVKVVFDGEHTPDDCGIHAGEYLLMPCDTGDAARNAHILDACITYVKSHPRWRMTLQSHKLINIR